MKLLDILKNNRNEINKLRNGILKESEKKIAEIISAEFPEYRIVVSCNTSGYDEVELHDGDRWVRYFMWDGKWGNGLHVRKSIKGSNDWTKAELKNIMERLSKLLS